MLVLRKILCLFAALIWGIPGILITLKGIDAYSQIQSSQLWWLFIITLCVVVFFFLIFQRVTKRYIDCIFTLPDRCYLYQTFPLKRWVLILFMMGLGMILKFISGIPIQFTASFYSGLGVMLILFALRFMVATIRL